MKSNYYKWITAEAQKIVSDGCTGVPDFHLHCCYEHDLAYYYGKCPRDAYRLGSWTKGVPLKRATADKRFRECIQKQSRLGKLSPMSWWRWMGVRLGGGKIWNKHRNKAEA